MLNSQSLITLAIGAAFGAAAVLGVDMLRSAPEDQQASGPQFTMANEQQWLDLGAQCENAENSVLNNQLWFLSKPTYTQNGLFAQFVKFEDYCTSVLVGAPVGGQIINGRIIDLQD